MAPKKRKTRVTKQAKQLLDPLQFIAAAQHEDGAPYESHCRIADGWVTATDGVLTIGHKFEGDLIARPHTLKMIAALKTCGPKLSITQLENDRLAIKSQNIKAIVPCLPEDETSFVVNPDPNIATINDCLKESFRTVAPFAKDNGDCPLTSSVIARANTCIGTNKHVIVESWHGIDLPVMLIPKRSVQAILKVSKPLTGFGFSGGSATFYFEDESWIRTQLYCEDLPNIDKILNGQCLPTPVPENFFEALEAIEPFSETDTVYITENKFSTHPTGSDDGAEYVVEGVDTEAIFGIKNLRSIENLVESIDIKTNSERAFFFGGSSRGVIAQKAR